MTGKRKLYYAFVAALISITVICSVILLVMAWMESQTPDGKYVILGVLFFCIGGVFIVGPTLLHAVMIAHGMLVLSEGKYPLPRDRKMRIAAIVISAISVVCAVLGLLGVLLLLPSSLSLLVAFVPIAGLVVDFVLYCKLNWR